MLSLQPKTQHICRLNPPLPPSHPINLHTPSQWPILDRRPKSPPRPPEPVLPLIVVNSLPTLVLGLNRLVLFYVWWSFVCIEQKKQEEKGRKKMKNEEKNGNCLTFWPTTKKERKNGCRFSCLKSFKSVGCICSLLLPTTSIARVFGLVVIRVMLWQEECLCTNHCLGQAIQ